MASTLPTATSLSPLLPKTLTPKLRPPPIVHLRRLHHPARTLTLPRAHSIADEAEGGIKIEEIIEKDLSFIQSGDADKVWRPKARRILSAASVGADSRVLVSFGGARFVDLLMEEFPCKQVIAIHDSILELALIKERQDDVRCWQGPIGEVPVRFWPFNTVILCYFPAMGVSVEGVLGCLAGRLPQGARVIFCLDQGKDVVKIHQKEHPDTVKSDLPSRASLEKASTKFYFKLVDFVDEPDSYLAVLEFLGS